MNVYPLVVEPRDDHYLATFPDIPELENCEGDQREDAISNAIERLNWVLADLYLEGRAMPLPSPILPGQLGIASPLHWILP